jgi:hypothetical protein
LAARGRENSEKRRTGLRKKSIQWRALADGESRRNKSSDTSMSAGRVLGNCRISTTRCWISGLIQKSIRDEDFSSQKAPRAKKVAGPKGNWAAAKTCSRIISLNL